MNIPTPPNSNTSEIIALENISPSSTTSRPSEASLYFAYLNDAKIYMDTVYQATLQNQKETEEVVERINKRQKIIEAVLKDQKHINNLMSKLAMSQIICLIIIPLCFIAVTYVISVHCFNNNPAQFIDTFNTLFTIIYGGSVISVILSYIKINAIDKRLKKLESKSEGGDDDSY